MSAEMWKAVPGYEGRYEVSDHGRVRSLRFVNGMVDKLRTYPKVLALNTDKVGRHLVALSKGGTAKTIQVHVLVLSAFVGPRPEGKDLCAHWDGDPSNNHLDNLRWATFEENEADKRRHGRHLTGERNHRAVLSDAQALEIRHRLHAGAGLRELATEYRVTPTSICEVALHRTFREIPNSPPPIHVARSPEGFIRAWETRRRKAALVASTQPISGYCSKGHPFNEQNTYVYRGKKLCRRCRADALTRLRVRRGGNQQGVSV